GCPGAELVEASRVVDIQPIDRVGRYLDLSSADTRGCHGVVEPRSDTECAGESGASRTWRQEVDGSAWIRIVGRVALLLERQVQVLLIVDVENRRVDTQAVIEEIRLVADFVLRRFLARHRGELSDCRYARVESRGAEAGCDRLVEQHVLGDLLID